MRPEEYGGRAGIDPHPSPSPPNTARREYFDWDFLGSLGGSGLSFNHYIPALPHAKNQGIFLRFLVTHTPVPPVSLPTRDWNPLCVWEGMDGLEL